VQVLACSARNTRGAGASVGAAPWCFVHFIGVFLPVWQCRRRGSGDNVSLSLNAMIPFFGSGIVGAALKDY
jgi:hypothetical protein